MTTNKKDKTEDILEKVKDILEKKDEKKRGCAISASSFFFFESVIIGININYISLNNPTTFPNTVTLSR